MSASEVNMKIVYFIITSQFAAPTMVAIFAQSAENASAIFGRSMHNIEQFGPDYGGVGLTLFRQSGKPDPLTDTLSSATEEGLGGYTLEGWMVLPIQL